MNARRRRRRPSSPSTRATSRRRCRLSTRCRRHTVRNTDEVPLRNADRRCSQRTPCWSSPPPSCEPSVRSRTAGTRPSSARASVTHVLGLKCHACPCLHHNERIEGRTSTNSAAPSMLRLRVRRTRPSSTQGQGSSIAVAPRPDASAAPGQNVAPSCARPASLLRRRGADAVPVDQRLAVLAGGAARSRGQRPHSTRSRCRSRAVGAAAGARAAGARARLAAATGCPHDRRLARRLAVRPGGPGGARTRSPILQGRVHEHGSQGLAAARCARSTTECEGPRGTWPDDGRAAWIRGRRFRDGAGLPDLGPGFGIAPRVGF